MTDKGEVNIQVQEQFQEKLNRLRWREVSALAVVWLIPTAAVGGISVTTVAGCLLVAHVAVLPLSVPIRPAEGATVNVATARRVFAATALAALVAAVWWMGPADDLHPAILAVLVAATWLELAVSTRIEPLAVQEAAPSVRSALILPTPTLPLLSRASKRLVDIVVSGALIVIAAPLLLLIIMAIRVGDGGPAFFRQKRLAQDGGSFEMLKFRSMVMNAERLQADLSDDNERSGPLFKMSNDPRITPIGRILRDLSLDELPQLVNIFRGDMSLVGPRPALPAEATSFDRQLQRRTLVKPGLTGLWQAEARSDPDFRRFKDLDLRYLEKCSPILDFWILLATATEVITLLVGIPLRVVGLRVATADGIRSADAEVIDLREHELVAETASIA